MTCLQKGDEGTESGEEPDLIRCEVQNGAVLTEDDVLMVIVGAGASFGCIPSAQVPSAGPRSMVRGPRGSSLPERPFSEVIPPVTQGLVSPLAFFNELVEVYWRAQPVVSLLRDRLAREHAPTPLEEALAEYQKLSQRNSMVDQELMAFRFYLRDLLLACGDYMRSPDLGGGITLYTSLVRECRDWCFEHGTHVCFVSFNYDTLLESACQTVWGFNPASADSYVADRRRSIIKPHGSALWERKYQIG